MKATIYITLTILLLSCGSDKCGERQKMFAEKIAEVLECEHIDKIEVSIAPYFSSDCKNQQHGLACNFVVDPIVELSMNELVPKEWGCKMKRSKEFMKFTLGALCNMV
jgi:chromosome condensin MukBEF ATPase and DNA-binding subunit MukB